MFPNRDFLLYLRISFLYETNILKQGRIVFNIKGNNYRLVVRVNFEKQWLFIRFIGTHEEYNKVDAENI